MSTSWVTAARQVPGLDHDPCPGDVPSVRRLAADLRARTDLLQEAVTACRGWEPVGWTGRAADAARVALSGLGDGLGTLRRSLEEAAVSLDAWASELDRLQDEATALGEQALDNRRRRLAATVRVSSLSGSPGTDLLLGDHADLVALERGRREIQHRAEELHLRWQADGRRAGAALDGTAPASPTGWWRGSWDLAHDRFQLSVRQQARVLSWQAGVLDGASAVSGVVALAVPPTAPVTVPLSLGLGVAGTGLHAQLAVGADGSPEPAVVGAVTLGAGGAVRGATRLAAGSSDTVERALPVVDDVVDGSFTGKDVGGVITTLVQGRRDRARRGTVADLAGVEVPVVVHDVAEPWQVGHGLRGAGFAGVATVPVTTPATAGPVVPRPPRTPTPLPERHVPAPHRRAASPHGTGTAEPGSTAEPAGRTRRTPSPADGG